jgi:ABC-type branched-subunit amino acid transport system permease subunit
MDIRSSLREGLLTGVINLFVILLGLTGLVGALVQDWLDLDSATLGAWVLLLSIALWGGARAGRRGLTKSPRDALLAGLFAGLSHGLLVGAFILFFSLLTEAGADIRTWLAQLTVQASRMYTFDLSAGIGALVAFALFTAAGLAGAALVFASARYRLRESVRRNTTAAVGKIKDVPAIQRFSQYKYSQPIVFAVVIIVLIVAPLLLNRYWNYTLGTVGIYVMLGLGLNIVVGFAGLLDLGYVAFFAIGAYTVGLLTAPEPHGLMISFWLALPIGVLVAGLSGILLGVPVLRMRGDYLAIVTLGFGEIIRILAKSDVLTSFSGGPRGVRDIGGPSLFGLDMSSAMSFMYLILLGIGLVAFVTNRLQYSRVGRAWMAMREDEDVAEAMGVFTLKYKLLAFAIGAAFAGLGGGFYASRNQFVGPEDFTLMVSVNVLCLVIIGGMGSIPGVIVGALVLKGLPEILRELDEYRMLFFGALLIFMMIVRPEGLWPSQRRRMELREEEELPIEYPAEGPSAATG